MMEGSLWVEEGVGEVYAFISAVHRTLGVSEIA